MSAPETISESQPATGARTKAKSPAGNVATSIRPVTAKEIALVSPPRARDGRTVKAPPAPLPSKPRLLGEHHMYESIDRALKASLARVTFGLSPLVLAEDTFDWFVHLAIFPGKRLQLLEEASRKAAQFGMYAAQNIANPATPPCISPLPQDRRFKAEAWRRWPYNLIYQSFLLTEEWWHTATTGIDGLSQRRQERLSFTVRQLLDVTSPSNYVWTNPEIAKATVSQGGRNLIQGWQNLVEDWQRATSGKSPVGAEQFVVGENVAITPGKVVFQNRLIELIQYSPTTEQVYAEPVLIVPAWIMKYYILDLSPQNSLVRYLVEHGHTVFMISWKNPTSEDRDLGMEEYRRLGIMAALDAVSAIVPGRKIHAAGYCLGGTMLTIAAATMARDGDDRLGSKTLFAAQADFTEAGELTLFINDSEISYLENMMWDRGYLDTFEMAGAFQILHSNDLIWSRVIREYLLGGRQPMNDLMAWNADATRMPYRMHSEYLRRLFLNNDLVEGRFEVDGHPIAVTDIRVPQFAVGTVADHVAPWHSVYKINLLPHEEITFVLTSGGHNAGIVSEPGHAGRTYQIRTKAAGERYVDPETWQVEVPVRQGSWWPEWESWLAVHSTEKLAPPVMGSPEKGYAPLRDAPGLYVRES
jgi:polyhydroxyalkanoate synthase